MMRRRIAWLASLALMAGAGPAAAQDAVQARPDGVTFTVAGAANTLMARDYMSLTVFAGYGGVYRPGHWTPVDVIVRAKMPHDLVEMAGGTLQGTLVVTIQTGVREREAHTMAVEIPLQGERRFPLLLLPEGHHVRVDFAPDLRGRTLNALLGTGIDRVVGVVRMRQAASDAVLVATLPRNERALRKASQGVRGPPFEVATLRTEGMPAEGAHWFGADAVVLTLTELGQLPPAVQDGLLLWVRSGGRLILTADRAQPRLSAEVASVLPARLSLGRQVIGDAALEAFGGGAPLPAGQRTFIAVQQLEPRGEVVLALGAQPLITRRWLGSGSLTLVGANLAAPPFLNWGGAPVLWAKLLPARPQRPSAGPGLRSALLAALLGFRELSAAGLSGVLGAFAIYAALLGGGLAWGLRQFQRPELYWPTTGVVVFSVMLATLSNPTILSIDTASVQTVSIVQARSGARVGRMETYAGGSATIASEVDLALAVEDGGIRAFSRSPEALGVTERVQEVGYDPLPVAHAIPVGPSEAGLVLGAGVRTAVPSLRFVHEGEGRYSIENGTGLVLASAMVVLPEGVLLLEPLSIGSTLSLAPRTDPSFHTWMEYLSMRRFAGLLPGVINIVPPARDVPGALQTTLVQQTGARWLGADPFGATLLAWWPMASIAAGDAHTAPLFRGHTLLAIAPEDA